MQGMGLAKPAVLLHFDPAGIVFLILHGSVISTFTLSAS